MASSLNLNCASNLWGSPKGKGMLSLRAASSGSSQFMESKSGNYPSLVLDHKGRRDWSSRATNNFSDNGKSICTSRGLRWWEKDLKPNMIEMHSAKQVVDYLLGAGDKLVIVDFWSPGCGGCKALHPKICQLAEQNPDAIFLSVNYEQLNVMCGCLNVHVLPFFRFYRGSEGRLCSFSCTVATIKKFKDALVRYGSDRCSLGPTKGLEKSELEKLIVAGQLSSNYAPPQPSIKEEKAGDLLLRSLDLAVSGVLNKADSTLPLELEEEGVLL